MTGKPLQSASAHCSDEQLLLHADGELPLPGSISVRRHLAACPECRDRVAKIESAVAGFAQAQLRSHAPAMDVSGPRALLRARLADLALNSGGVGSRRHLRYARSVAYACALALMAVIGLAVFRYQAANRLDASLRLLPDPSFTPGATRDVALANLCSSGSEDVVRSVPGSLQQKVFQEYGIHNIPAAEFEVDYLITPGLGGSDDVRNLWPQPHSNTAWNSYVKDQLEDRLHRMVCERQISLSEAQREIAGNWIAAYKKYFRTDHPLSNPSVAETSGDSDSETTQRSSLLPIGSARQNALRNIAPIRPASRAAYTG